MRTFRMLIQCGVVGSALCLGTLTGSAASNNPVGVSISVKTSDIQVIVSQPTSLVDVLGQLCYVTKADCEGTDLASESTVAPLTVEGNWEQVTSSLMDGTGLNYVMVPPSDGGTGKIWITGLSIQPGSTNNSVSDCQSGRRRRLNRAMSGLREENSCAFTNALNSASGSPGLPQSSAAESEVVTPDLSPDAPHDEAANSERGAGSPFPDASAPANNANQAQSSGSPFPESLATK